jgi:hypothetical protein
MCGFLLTPDVRGSDSVTSRSRIKPVSPSNVYFQPSARDLRMSNDLINSECFHSRRLWSSQSRQVLHPFLTLYSVALQTEEQSLEREQNERDVLEALVTTV